MDNIKVVLCCSALLKADSETELYLFLSQTQACFLTSLVFRPESRTVTWREQLKRLLASFNYLKLLDELSIAQDL